MQLKTVVHDLPAWYRTDTGCVPKLFSYLVSESTEFLWVAPVSDMLIGYTREKMVPWASAKNILT